jgi:hypothetical protein
LKFPGTENTLAGTILFHIPTRTAVLNYKHLPDLSTEEGLFDVLAQYGVATVNIGFDIEETHPSCSVGEAMDAKGEEIDLENLPGDDGDLGSAILTAIDGFAEEYAREAIVGDTDWEPRYANESYTQFQGAEGTVTFDILKRQVSLEGTASVKSVEVTEDAVDVSETWEIGKTEKAA